MSMLAPFADRAARVRGAQIRHCANAVAVFPGAEPFGVIFSRSARESLGLIGGYAPRCSLYLASAPGLEQGSIMEIDGVAYQIAGPVEPDSSGWATLQLRTAGDANG